MVQYVEGQTRVNEKKIELNKKCFQFEQKRTQKETERYEETQKAAVRNERLMERRFVVENL